MATGEERVTQHFFCSSCPSSTQTAKVEQRAAERSGSFSGGSWLRLQALSHVGGPALREHSPAPNLAAPLSPCAVGAEGEAQLKTAQARLKRKPAGEKGN